MAILENEILEARNPKIKDSDNWPSYTLKRTKVLSQTTGEPVSLFAANTNNPVQVLGTLETVDPAYRQNIKNDKYRSKTIELAGITTYAFAEYDDGTYGFWAAGRAGWFELRDPAPVYKQTFDRMHEAASMFYMLADKLRRALNKNPKLSGKGLERYANAIFKDYYLHGSNPFRRVDADDVREGFHEHREYIITCMFEAQEDLDWEKSAIFTYYKHKFPETVAEVQSRMTRNKGRNEPNATYEAQRRNSRPDKPDKSDKPDKTNDTGKSRGRPPARNVTTRNASKNGAKQDPIVLDDSSSSSSDASGDDDPETPSPKSSPENGSHKRKSILQPKGSKYSTKAMQRRGKLPVAKPSNSDNSSDEEMVDGASPLATAAARNTTTLPTRTSSRPTKHSSALDDYASHHTYLPRITEKKILVSYPLPSTEPQGPGDIWTCTFEGCNKRVHAASTEEGQAEMQEHFREHTASAAEKIQLAMTESRPYLPVNNLVAHLQACHDNEPAEGTHDGAAPGKLFPKPIKRSRFFS